MNLCAQEGHCWRKGWFHSLCFQKRECQDGLDCVTPTGVQTQVCSKDCQSDADCSVDGRQGKCADPGTGTKMCMIPCEGSSDCPGHLPNCANKVCWK
jgi:hypothetical protein